MQASYNEDANMIMEEANQDKASLETLNFLMNLITIAIAAEDKVTTKEKPRYFKCVEPSKGRVRKNDSRQLKKNLRTLPSNKLKFLCSLIVGTQCVSVFNIKVNSVNQTRLVACR